MITPDEARAMAQRVFQIRIALGVAEKNIKELKKEEKDLTKKILEKAADSQGVLFKEPAFTPNDICDDCGLSTDSCACNCMPEDGTSEE